MLPSGEAAELSAGASRVYTASDCVNPFRTQRLVEASLANSAAARRASALGEDARARRGGGEACAALPRAAWRALPAAGAREAAAAAFREGDAAAAVALLGEALGADAAAQRDASLWANRSAARLAAGDAQGAREDAERAAQLAPGEVKPLYRLAKACEKAGDALAAREACKRALKLDPDNAQLLQFFKALPRS